MRNVIIALVVLVVLGLGGWYLLQSRAAAPTPVQTPTESTAPSVSPDATPESTTGATQGMKEFTVSGANFSFTPTKLTVNKGDKVKITFKNDEGFHNWVLDEFNAKTATVQAGKTATVEFVADKVGSFEYYCSVGNHRAQGMKGTLVVE